MSREDAAHILVRGASAATCAVPGKFLRLSPPPLSARLPAGAAGGISAGEASIPGETSYTPDKLLGYPSASINHGRALRQRGEFGSGNFKGLSFRLRRGRSLLGSFHLEQGVCVCVSHNGYWARDIAILSMGGPGLFLCGEFRV